MSVGALEPMRTRASGDAAATPGRAGQGGGLLLGAMAAALVAGRFETAGAALLVGALGAAAAGARWPARAWWLGLGGVALVSLALNLWLVRGRALPLPVLLGHPATFEGAGLGVLLALRVVGAAVAVHGLRAAWPGERAADELARALAPLERLGVPVRRAHAVLGLALRVAPLLRDETRRIARLQTLRAGRPPRTAGERLTRARATLVPALVGAMERAEQLALALEARHWHARALPAARAPGWGGWAGLALAALALCWRSG